MTVRDGSGFSLVETVFALSLLLVVALGLLPLGIVATMTTENQGYLTARTTGYAQDKLEQLLTLSYDDLTSDTRVLPIANGGGSGLAVGGSSDPDAPVDPYVDYLDVNGTLMPSGAGVPPAGWFYKRTWAVASPAVNLKEISVTASVSRPLGHTGAPPRSTVVALKANPF
jgi:hypothetical protein